jgi:hypothetical protein
VGRKIAAFLTTAADKMEQMGSVYEHEHFADKQPGFGTSPHFVLFNPTAEQALKSPAL